ncbi:NUDIX hydrolase, partial [Actinomyces sp. MRS3W]|nr:NUDIX hydrolase [Actinomyces sp. MRS3W]
MWGPGRADDPEATGPRLAPLTAADLDTSGLTCFYLGRETGTGTGDAAGDSWLAVVVPTEDVASPPDAEGAGRAHPGLYALLERYPLSALRAV